MTYAYDAIAMSHPAMLDPFRVTHTLEFQHTHDDDDVLVDASTLTLEGPRGPAEFALMWDAYRVQGIASAKLQAVLAIRIGARKRNVAAQRQMLSIMRWLLACAGYGEDVLQEAIIAAMEARNRGNVTVGEIMAHTPATIESIEWARREPPRDNTPIEWLA